MNLDFEKYANGLVPAIVQHATTHSVLMLGFMDREAVEKTLETGRVTFYSRSKERLWTKGETSGNFLKVVAVKPDCDNDTLLITAHPLGPVCHTGDATCFGVDDEEKSSTDFLTELEQTIRNRRENPTENSYVAKLFAKGLNKIAQKVGEETVETVIAAKDDNVEAFKNEAADLLFHFLVLLNKKDSKLADVIEILRTRQKN